ncbi:hypothetical protein ACFPN7_25870 [Amycolatopsis halotolerans]|uniref:hypothetical protein n=1 Tax=Amycolatopsis halotolerans TaxID=330083 RepID=UPI0036199961
MPGRPPAQCETAAHGQSLSQRAPTSLPGGTCEHIEANSQRENGTAGRDVAAATSWLRTPTVPEVPRRAPGRCIPTPQLAVVQPGARHPRPAPGNSPAVRPLPSDTARAPRSDGAHQEFSTAASGIAEDAEYY